MGPGRRKLLIVTVVWGDWYVDALAGLALPALLAPHNLPFLARQCDIEYLIVTRPNEQARLEASQAVQLARRFMTVGIVPSLPAVIDASVNVFNFHHAVWSFAYQKAKQDNSYVLNLPPDSIFADGAGATWAKLIGEGKTSVTWISPRGLDTAIPALKERVTAEGPLVMTPADMVGLNLEHLHPLSKTYFADSDHFPAFHPEMIIWPVANEGVVLHWLVGEGRLFDPNQVELSPQQVMTGKIDPSRFAFIDDSDDLYALALTTASHNKDWYRSADRAVPAQVGRWWLNFDGTSNDLMAAHKVRIHAGPMTASLWRARERGSDLFVSRAAASREFFRVAQLAFAADCSWTAALLMNVARTNVCLRVASRPMRVIVFGPTDSVASRISLANLLKPEAAGRLLKILRRHVVADEEPDTPLIQRLVKAGGVLRLRSLAGETLTLAAAGDGRWKVNDCLLGELRQLPHRHSFVATEGFLDSELTAARAAA